MKLLDLSHVFAADMPVYPGDVKSELKQVAFVRQDGASDHRLNTGMHVGTHMDAPAHMIEGGRLINDFSPEKFFGRGVLIDVRGQQSIDVNSLAEHQINKNDIVLFWTGFAEKFKTEEYYSTHPKFTTELAHELVKKEVSIIGLDTPSPDYSPFESHKILLNKEILIIENLVNLDRLAKKSFEIIALPLRLEANASPCRVVAKMLQ